jgi:hypothetical protein
MTLVAYFRFEAETALWASVTILVSVAATFIVLIFHVLSEQRDVRKRLDRERERIDAKIESIRDELKASELKKRNFPQSEIDKTFGA